MPRIFDNLTPSTRLLGALQESLALSSRADFCVGYFNLRGWGGLAGLVDKWESGKNPCRILIGMQRPPHEELRAALSLAERHTGVDNQTAHRLKTELAENLRKQLTFGAPTDTDERVLRQLAAQLRSRKVAVKLFLRHPLHAKLYLSYRDDPVNPIIGYLGSSNLTFAGLVKQGELNVDLLDRDDAIKLSTWFDERWNDQYCVNISDELLQIIEDSWARADLVPPYHLYLKMAYHLSHEARAGLTEFRIPRIFGNRLFDFQSAAVKIAAHHLNKRNGVLIGDVVGLGKTLMAVAIAKIFEEDFGLETLIICPKNLEPMWDDYVYQYHLRAKILPLSRVLTTLPELRRYRLVVIDESHNLRNRDGKRYRAIREYVKANDSKCVLLSATPYNKTYKDLSNQLRIFVEDDEDIGIRPERLIRELGETEFSRRHQASPRSIQAFDISEYADDWRELMRLYLVRRTRSFIQNNYARTDTQTGRKYLTYEDGTRSFFPIRKPKTVKFRIDESDPDDQYALLYSPYVIETLNSLNLPRYGLGNYINANPSLPANASEERQINDLSRAGKRLMGFCRTNLLKRLESSGAAFLQSVQRHILRNYVFLHAMKHGLPLPIGPQDSELLDLRFAEEDDDSGEFVSSGFERGESASMQPFDSAWDKDNLASTAGKIYESYAGPFKKRFKWLRSDLFRSHLEFELRADTDALLNILRTYGSWDPTRDAKLDALHSLLTDSYPNRKILVFSQFADTVRYLEFQLKDRGVRTLGSVTGNSPDPTQLARRFSPGSNKSHSHQLPGEDLRVLIATDVLSEGQNLQDCHVVVNYDLPWAIIRLIQRAGRVDRIGQKSQEILCHSFLPADGVERIIELRKRVRQRLNENAEVVGADEKFFEDEDDDRAIVNLYHERAGILDGDLDSEVDLASHAYQIWNNAISGNPQLEKAIVDLPNMVYSTRHHTPSALRPEGVLVFMRAADGNDALIYVDKDGQSITESQLEILAAAECEPETPAQPRNAIHHQLVVQGVQQIVKEEKWIGGQLGRPSGPRFQTYKRLKTFSESKGLQLSYVYDLRSALNELYRFPLRQTAIDTLNRQLRSSANDRQLADIVVAMHRDERLCVSRKDFDSKEPEIIGSVGLFEYSRQA